MLSTWQGIAMSPAHAQIKPTHQVALCAQHKPNHNVELHKFVLNALQHHSSSITYTLKVQFIVIMIK